MKHSPTSKQQHGRSSASQDRMKALQAESDLTLLATLQERIALLEAENLTLQDQVQSVLQEKQELQRKLERLLEQHNLNQHARFGQKSERSEYIQQSFFDEPELTADETVPEPTMEEVEYVLVKKRKQSKPYRERLPEGLPVEVIDYELPVSACQCTTCAATLQKIGVADRRRRLKIIPATMVIQEERSYAYTCPHCSEETGESDITTSTLPGAVLPGSLATEETIAHIAIQKYATAKPLHRQQQEWADLGVEVSKQTMSNWLLSSSERYFEPLIQAMRQALVQESILHADETSVQVLREEGKAASSKSFMWLYRTGPWSKQQLVLYQYEQDRRHIRPKTFLDGFQGYLQTDGYSAYKQMDKSITQVGCWAHARRKFNDALVALPAKRRKQSDAYKAIQYCDVLFGLEGDWKSLTVSERLEKRQKKGREQVDAYFDWLKGLPPCGRNKFGEAVEYSLNQEASLRVYLKDARLELSNNLAERSIRPFVIGRKNWLFANTVAGAQASSAIYSLIETAKANGFSAYAYLLWVLKEATRLQLDRYPEQAKRLLPDQYRIHLEMQENMEIQV